VVRNLFASTLSPVLGAGSQTLIGPGLPLTTAASEKCIDHVLWPFCAIREGLSEEGTWLMRTIPKDPDVGRTLRSTVCTVRGRDLSNATLTTLVERALQRDETAWSALVDRVQRVVWKSVNLVTSNADIRKEAFASTMLRLAEHLGKVREPEKLPGWLAVTATREAIAVSQSERRRSEVPVMEDRRAGTRREEQPDAQVEQRDAVLVVRRALARLEPTCRELLTILFIMDPPMPYEDIAEHMERPVGWIGPTRQRCLQKLRLDPTVGALQGARQR
jgi:RNA polymerase sigma factor (sigma-70 family)